MLLLLPFLLTLGLFLPGYFVARSCQHNLWWASAFVISLVILFNVVFWLGTFHVPIVLWTAGSSLLLVTASTLFLRRSPPAPRKVKRGTGLATRDRILVVSMGFVAAVLTWRSAVSPLIGFDTLFRWDFLAQRLLALGNFAYYPPLTPADFHNYFYVDGIPPLVSFTHWWMYASAGRHLPSLISVFVAAQLICTLGFTYGIGSAIGSRRAGVLSAAILAASPLYFRSVVIGQETGLTALSVAALLYFIVTARQEDRIHRIVFAGLSAGLCALAREYGWIAVVAGVIALVWRRRSYEEACIFAMTAGMVAAPWYIRNWVISGNPFFGLHLGSFAVNPTSDAILQFYDSVLGVRHWTGSMWLSSLGFLLSVAPIQFLVGVIGGFRRFRERGYLIVIAVILAAVWFESIGYTSAGFETSTRVLTPMLVVLSATAGAFLDGFIKSPGAWSSVVAVLVACHVWTAGHGVLYPNNPFTLSPAEWLPNAFQPTPEQPEFQIRDQLIENLPKGSRILSDNAYLHAALVDSSIEVVPIWSPEVRFLFSSSFEESEQRLRSLGIGSVALYPESLNTAYLTSSSAFYSSLPQRWHVLAQTPGFVTIFTP